MQSATEIKSKLEEIRNSDFEVEEIHNFFYKSMYVNLLRKALICFNDIGTNFPNKKLSQEEKEYLYNELDKIMKNKLKEINNNFSEETIDNMLATYKRGIVIWPMDILVIDDAVFHTEARKNNNDYIDQIDTFMFEGMRPYYHISDIDFEVMQYIILPPWRNELTKEDEKNYFKFISDSINSIHKKNITMPIYEQNYGNFCFGPPSLIDKGKSKTYISMNFYDIVEKILKKEECDIKICIKDEDNITLYYVHQHFKDDKPIWDVEKTNNDIWKLSEEILKWKNNQASNFQKKKI